MGITPCTRYFFTWAQIKRVCYRNGDVYLLVPPLSGWHVPRSAFSSLAAAQAFADAAKRARLGDFSLLTTSAAVINPDVWPPSPHYPR